MGQRMVTAFEIERGHVNNYWARGCVPPTVAILDEEMSFWWDTILELSEMKPPRRLAWLTLHNTTMKALGIILSNHRRVRRTLSEQCGIDAEELL